MAAFEAAHLADQFTEPRENIDITENAGSVGRSSTCTATIEPNTSEAHDRPGALVLRLTPEQKVAGTGKVLLLAVKWMQVRELALSHLPD